MSFAITFKFTERNPKATSKAKMAIRNILHCGWSVSSFPYFSFKCLGKVINRLDKDVKIQLELRPKILDCEHYFLNLNSNKSNPKNSQIFRST